MDQNFSASLFPGSNSKRSDRMTALFEDANTSLAVFFLQMEGSVKAVDEKIQDERRAKEEPSADEKKERVKITSKMVAFFNKPLDLLLSKSHLDAAENLPPKLETVAVTKDRQPKVVEFNELTKDQAVEIAKNVNPGSLAKTASNDYNIHNGYGAKKDNGPSVGG